MIEQRRPSAAGDEGGWRGDGALSLGEAARELARTAGETIAESHRLREQAQMHRSAARRIKERVRRRRSELARTP